MARHGSGGGLERGGVDTKSNPPPFFPLFFAITPYYYPKIYIGGWIGVDVWIGEKKSNKKIKKKKIVDEFWGWIIHPSHPQTISAV
jgi:hypothetical protein